MNTTNANLALSPYMGTGLTLSDDSPPLVLASGSAIRRELLVNAGLSFVVEPAHVDESLVKQDLAQEGASAEALAETLAELKARQVALRHPDALVLGCDQVLACGKVLFDKPADLDHVAAHLHALSGKTHSLHVSAVIQQGDQRIWHVNRRADLTMRDLSDAYIARYVEAVGEQVMSSVGAYQLEGLGAQLFSRIEGDYFTILGLPLLDILGFLRLRGGLTA